MSGKWRDYYRILGVRRNATQSEIKEAWIFGVKAFHPDKFAGSSEHQQAIAQERTKAVNEAYYILSDASRRADYDREYARRTNAKTASPPPRATPPPSRATPPPKRTKTASSADTSTDDNYARQAQNRKTDRSDKQNRNQSFPAVAYVAGLYIPWLIAAVMLISAAIEKHPYSFYMLLRWVCCAMFAWSAFVAHEKNRQFWVWGFAALAALYNPIVVVHLNRSTWINVNWFTFGVIVVAAIAFLPRRAQISTGATAALIAISIGLWQLQPVSRPQASMGKARPSVSESPSPTLETSPDIAYYKVIVRDGLVTVVDSKSNRMLGSTTLERWGVATSTQDKLRHVALDFTAAMIAGNGGREHTVSPESPVYTVADVNKHNSSAVTGTIENGSTFFLLSDTLKTDSYDALIGTAKFQSALSRPDIFDKISVDPNSQVTPIPRAIPRAIPVAPTTDTSAVRGDTHSRSLYDLFDVSTTATTPVAASSATEPPASDSTLERTTIRPKLVYAPHPSYPPKADKMRVTGSGQFKITFDERGNTKSVEIVQSTGNSILDSNTIKTLKRWRSAPGNASSVVVPIDYRQKQQSRLKPRVTTSRPYQSVPAPQSATAPLIDPNISR